MTIVNETQLIFEGMQLMNALYTFEMFYAFSRFTTIKNTPLNGSLAQTPGSLAMALAPSHF